MPLDYIKIIEQIVKEKRPDVDFRPKTPAHDLLALPLAFLQAPLNDDITTLKTLQSVLESENLTEADMDALIANIYINRQTGAFATGLARIYFSAPLPVIFRTTDLFVADNNTTFVPIRETTFPESIVRLNTAGSLFFVDVPVVATAAGTSSQISAHSLTTIQGSAQAFVRVDNPFPFSGGAARETNVELKERAQHAITVRDLVSGNGILTTLAETFTFIDRIFVAGFLDPEMQRDLFEEVHIGNRADIYIKTSGLTPAQIKIQVPDLDGNFIVSSTSTAPGNAQRPVVFVDSVRLLDGSATPVGDPLNREETELVPITAIVTTGEVVEPSTSFNDTLNQMSMVAVERVSETERYVVFFRLSVQGAIQIGPVRISPANASIVHPFVKVNPVNNRAYVFWGQGGTLKGKILDVSGSALVVVKDTFDVVAGSDTIQSRIDVDFDAASGVHIAFTRRITALDGTTQDNPWYARLDANGVVPGLVTPRQLVVGLSGNNREATLVASSSGASLKVTVIFAQHLAESSNLLALQLDNNGQFIGSSTPTELTQGFELNDLPTARSGPSSSIHILWRSNQKGISYMRVLEAGLALFTPQTLSITRELEIDEVRGIVNAFGQLYAYWTEFAGDFTDVFTAKLDPEGARIGPIQDVTQTPYFSKGASLEIDSTGDLHLVWTDGVRGLDKPHYTKRSPQEWHLVVTDPNFRYSGRENLTVVPEVPAANGVAVDVQWAELLPQVQTFVLSDLPRTITADLLVRHQIPATVSAAIKFGPRDGSLTEAAALALVKAYVEDFQGAALDVSTIMNLLIEAGATSVTPFELVVKIDQLDGTLEIRRGTDSVELPRGVFLKTQNLTTTFK